MFLHSYIPNSVLLDFGFYQIRWYGLVLTLAVAGGFFVVWRLFRLRRYGLAPLAGGFGGQVFSSFDKDKIFNLLFWIAIWGIISGRLVHILTFFGYYWHRPLQILAIWNGGIAFYGVFMGGLIAAWVLIQRECHSEERSDEESRGNDHPRSLTPIAIGVRDDKKKAILSLLDALVVGLAFGQFIGRWGNWFNQEIFGGPTSLPWGIPIDIWHRPVGLENFTYFHPVFLYESLFSLGLFLLLFWVYKKIYRTDDLTRPRFARPTSPCKGEGYDVPPPLNKGRVGERSYGVTFSVFLICHSAARFFLEFLRLDAQPEIFGLRFFQWVAVAEFIVGLLVYFYVKVWYNRNKDS